MSNIRNYIQKYGNLTFQEKTFNEIDQVILSLLSYISFDNIIPSTSSKKITLKEATKKYIRIYSRKQISYNVMGVKVANQVLKYIYKEKRYKDLLLYNYVYKCDDQQQFSAMFIDLKNKTTFISFEGTDDKIVGWKEDFEMLYKYPVTSQQEAIKYLKNKISIFSNRKYIFGGHSKGGNLALVSGMESSFIIRNKIEKIYANDSPGLKLKQIESNKYKRIEKKIIRILPNTSIIGLILRRTEKYDVVKCDKNGMASHNPLNWKINDLEFIRTNLTSSSTKLDNLITEWLNTYNDEERKAFVDDLFDLFKRSNINSVIDMKSSKIASAKVILKNTSYFDEKTKRMIKELLNCIISVLKEGISTKIHK